MNFNAPLPDDHGRRIAWSAEIHSYASLTYTLTVLAVCSSAT